MGMGMAQMRRATVSALVGACLLAVWIHPAVKHGHGEPEEAPCDPFGLPGYLAFDALRPGNNLWHPFPSSTHPSCPPSTLFQTLLGHVQAASRDGLGDRVLVEQLPWLVNKTVVLIGDSIDRDALTTTLVPFKRSRRPRAGSF